MIRNRYSLRLDAPPSRQPPLLRVVVAEELVARPAARQRAVDRRPRHPRVLAPAPQPACRRAAPVEGHQRRLVWVRTTAPPALLPTPPQSVRMSSRQPRTASRLPPLKRSETPEPAMLPMDCRSAAQARAPATKIKNSSDRPRQVHGRLSLAAEGGGPGFLRIHI